MPDEPINVVGAGFVAIIGIAGIYGNNTIPPEQKEDAPVLPTPDAPMLSSLPSSEQISTPIETPAQEEAQPSSSPQSESNSDE